MHDKGKFFKRAGVVLLALIVAFGIVIAIFDWNWLRGPIAHAVEARTGRSFAIEGNLSVHLSFTPRVTMERVRFGNPAWASEPQMFQSDRASFTVRLLDLIRGKVVLPDIELTHPEINLEQSSDGKKSWVIGDGSKREEPSVFPDVGSLRVDTGTLSYQDPQTATSIVLKVDTDPARGELATRFKASGRYKNVALDADGQTAAVLDFLDRGGTFPLKVQARAGTTRASFDGTLTDLSSFSAIDADVSAQGDDLAKLYPLIPVPLPPSRPYRVKGHLKHDGTTWAFNNFSGQVGRSDLTGSLSFVAAKENARPRLSGALSSKLLDIADLQGFLGKTPETSKKTATPKKADDRAASQAGAQAKLSSKTANASKRVLPDEEFRLDKLQAMDADVKLTAQRVDRPEALPINTLSAHLLLNNGVLKLMPLNFGVAGGNVVSDLTLNATQKPIAAQAHIKFLRLKFRELFPTVKMAKDDEGLVGGSGELSSRGNSTAQLLAHVDGQLGLVIAGGTFSNLLLEFAGLDGAESIKFLIGGDKTVKLRCGVATFKIKNGQMNVETLVLDTSDTKIWGEGSINLASEELTLRLHPEPKDFSILSLRAPLEITGTFGDPKFRPDLTMLGARVGASVLLGTLLTPLAALIPLIETGPGEDSNCPALMKDAQNRTGAKPPAAAPRTAQKKS